MAEERTLGLARAREEALEDDREEPSKAALQRRMEETRDSISNTVTEIKETVSQQYENVKDALDWREHFKRQPIAWSLGAAGVGVCVGYCIASALSGDDSDDIHYASAPARSLTTPPREAVTAASPSNGKDEGPGMLERFRETSAYDRLSKEAGALGDRLVEELSTTAQQVVLPALLKKIKSLIGIDLSDKSTSMRNQHETGSPAYEPALGRSSEF